MQGMHGKYRASPKGCVTGVISIFLMGVSLFFLIYGLTAPEATEEQRGPRVIAYLFIGAMLAVGVILFIKSFVRLKKNVKDGEIEKM
jgi:hypothetical protein